jgi:hypothetical protein
MRGEDEPGNYKAGAPGDAKSDQSSTRWSPYKPANVYPRGRPIPRGLLPLGPRRGRVLGLAFAGLGFGTGFTAAGRR